MSHDQCALKFTMGMRPIPLRHRSLATLGVRATVAPRGWLLVIPDTSNGTETNSLIY